MKSDATKDRIWSCGMNKWICKKLLFHAAAAHVLSLEKDIYSRWHSSTYFHALLSQFQWSVF